MIGRLQGTILEKQPPWILIDVQGVGYELEASMSTFYHLPDCGESVTLHTHLVVREDAQLLYGFYSLSERQMFRNLIKISGVGPKLALTILSGMSAEDFSRCIVDGDSKALTRLWVKRPQKGWLSNSRIGWKKMIRSSFQVVLVQKRTSKGSLTPLMMLSVH
jgi:Holliday junction DNA helicase RuvA